MTIDDEIMSEYFRPDMTYTEEEYNKLLEENEELKNSLEELEMAKEWEEMK